MKVASKEVYWLAVAVTAAAAVNEEKGELLVIVIVVEKPITIGEMNGIKTIYNPAEKIIEQSFIKVGFFLSASLPPI
jgi:hypothetical protein